MNTAWQVELKAAIESEVPLRDIVTMLRRFRSHGVSQDEAYAFLASLAASAGNDAAADRVAEVADFVAGFCSPHMKIWDTALPAKLAGPVASNGTQPDAASQQVSGFASPRD